MGDLDGDGAQDVACVHQLDESLSVYWSAEAPAQTVPVGRAASNPAVGDLNVDGRPELVVARPDLASLVDTESRTRVSMT